MNNRDVIVLKKIIQYANEIDGTITRFDLNYNKFEDD
jgi:predicted RNA-binding protein